MKELPDIIALLSSKGINLGRPEVVMRGNGKSGSISRRDLKGFPDTALKRASWLDFRYLTVNTSP
jgi:hypothetical protein